MSPRLRSDWSYSRQFVTRYAVVSFGCRWARVWGSVMHSTVGCWGWSWLKHDARFTRRQERLGYLGTSANTKPLFRLAAVAPRRRWQLSQHAAAARRGCAQPRQAVADGLP